MNFRIHRKQEELSINITPLIDVVFLLLIFFMLTTTFAKEKKLQINLPHTTAATEEPIADSLEVSIDAQGDYYINNKHLTNRNHETLLGALQQVLVSTNTTSADTPLRLVADGKTPHQAVVTALDVVGKMGFTSVEIATISGRNS